MTLKADDLKILYDATPDDEIKKRQGPRKHEGTCPKFGVCPQAHMMLDYVDARYVMDKLDHLGPENWQDMFVDRSDGSVRCGIGIHIGDEWIWKWDVGTVSDIEPEKGAYSEAFKRAGVKWGIARDLYGHKGTSRPAAQPARPVAPAVVAALAAQPANSPLARLVQAEVDAGHLQAIGPNEPPEISEEELNSLAGNTRPAPQRAPQAVPTCPVHTWDDQPRPMKYLRGEWKCTARVGDGYCGERAK